MMKTIETTATIAEDGTLTIHLPPDIPRGIRRVVLVIDDQPVVEVQPKSADFPVIDVGPWPENLSLRREDMYDKWGR
jgi:hypothetical protein